MGNVEKAVAFSVLTHIALAALIAFFLDAGVPATASPDLEVSAVELSLSEERQEVVRRESRPVSGAETRYFPSSPEESRPPEPVKTDMAGECPAEPGEVRIRRLDEPFAEMKSVSPAAAPPLPESAAEQARIDAPARPKKNIRIVYPRSSRSRSEEGLVKLSFTVDAFGSVSGVSITASSGFPELDEAAVKAVCSALFIPARKGEKAVESVVSLTFDFRLK